MKISLGDLIDISQSYQFTLRHTPDNKYKAYCAFLSYLLRCCHFLLVSIVFTTKYCFSRSIFVFFVPFALNVRSSQRLETRSWPLRQCQKGSCGFILPISILRHQLLGRYHQQLPQRRSSLHCPPPILKKVRQLKISSLFSSDHMGGSKFSVSLGYKIKSSYHLMMPFLNT